MNFKEIRPFGWVILAINAYFVYTLFSGVAGSSGSDTATGIFVMMLLFVWAIVNVPLYIVYKVTGGKKRQCPACGINVKVGVLKCPACGLDFYRHASGGSQ